MTKTDIWQQHIKSWQGSGLTQTAFCEQQHIKLHNFQYWRKRLSNQGEQPGVFVPVTVSRSAPARLVLGSHVAIELPCESLPDVLLALRDRGLLHASP